MSAALPSPTRRTSLAQRLRQLRDATLQPQVSTAARERRDLLVLLAALAFVVAPHIAHLPWWATALLVVLWFWRLWLVIAQRPLPGRFAMLPLLIAAAGAVWLEHRTLLGRDAGVTFLLMLLALKLLEMRARRDVFVVIFLAFFILLTQFLFGQGVLVALMTLIAVLLLFFLLVSVNLAEGDLHARAKLRLVGVVFLKSLPLAAALFVLFPRLNAPLWGLPGDTRSARTGLSNTMTPGAIGRLLESDEIAFRALFSGQVPLSDQLYWRGPVLGSFTGRTWMPAGDGLVAATLDLQPGTDPVYEYTITQEPNQRDWLFALDLPVDLRGAADFSPRLRADGQLLAGRLIAERARYTLRSATSYRLGLNETRLSLQNWLQLPPGYNPRTLELAAELRRTVPGAMASRSADAALVQAALQRFRQQNYTYTLQPPTLGRNSVDEFLFDTRAGYCEHYASAFVVLMRALDIPARVVTGYQGGEFNPIDGFLTVRQADAHAWAEVWLEGRGWVRVDPTAAVAPERVIRGGRTAAAAASTQGGPVLGERAFSLLRAIRFQWEALENGWNQWVLSYTPERQRELLSRLGLMPDGRTLALVFAVVISAILLVLAVISLRHRTERDRLGELLARLRERLTAVGIDAPSHLGPRALLALAAPRLDAASADETRRLIDEFERWRYSRASAAMPAAAQRALRARLRRYRPRLAR
jgi:transglutaminase-like putative cysteine protease